MTDQMSAEQEQPAQGDAEKAYEEARALARSRFGQLTPFRLGMAMAELGYGNMPNPYIGSGKVFAEKHYRDGVLVWMAKLCSKEDA